MKKITLVALLISGFIGFSQPVLNSSDFSTSFTTDGFYIANPTGFTNGPSGDNVVWDYSTIVLPAVNQTYSVVPVSEAYFASSIPSANYCEKFVSNGNAIYFLYTLSNTSFELVGISNIDFMSSYMANSATIYQFPYVYQNIINDTQWPQGSPTPPEPTVKTYDGYGTLITPYGTFSNVIRQKLVNGFGQVSYTWFATNPYRIILKANFEAGSATFYLDSFLNNEPSVMAVKCKVYPNPATETIALAIPEGSEKLTVHLFDTTGKQLLQNENYSSNSPISLKKYAAGVYIIKVTNEHDKIIHTQKIIKN